MLAQESPTTDPSSTTEPIAHQRLVPANDLLRGKCKTSNMRCEWLEIPSRNESKCGWHGDGLKRDPVSSKPKKCDDCQRDGAPRRTEEI